MNYAELRLKFRHFVRKYQKLILIALIVWGLVFLLNLLMAHRTVEPEAETSYEVHASVIDSSDETPRSMQQPIEEKVKEYVGYCNEGNYQKAFDMLSEGCRKYAFNDDIYVFMDHVLTKMPTPKEYVLQDYSNMKYDKDNLYIYEIKYLDDYLSTGLTNQVYSFTSERMTFFENEDGNIEMNVGNFIYHTDIKSISENEYLKLDVIDKVVRYSIETYKVKLTNRSQYTVVIADGEEDDEVSLKLTNETRKRSEITDIVLAPKEEIELEMTFPKFVDDGDLSTALVLSSVRVMETYSATDEVPEETIQYEIDNAISKFSMEANIID